MKTKTTDPATLRRLTRNRAAVRKWKRKHPRAASAHSKVHHALKDGTLTRLPCEVCGVERTEAHHDDYADALVVRWLCRVHHKEHHRKIRLVQAELNFGKRKEVPL